VGRARRHHACARVRRKADHHDRFAATKGAEIEILGAGAADKPHAFREEDFDGCSAMKQTFHILDFGATYETRSRSSRTILHTGKGCELSQRTVRE